MVAVSKRETREGIMKVGDEEERIVRKRDVR